MSETELISSAANPLIKRLRRLQQRRYRRAEGAAVVHGIQPVRQAYEAGFEIDILIVAPGLLRAASAQEFVTVAERTGIAVARLTDELFTRISDREGPTGMAAIVRITETEPGELPDTAGAATWLAVDRIGNPGNLGTILRTADATGTDGVLLVGPGADVWDPATIKASMGAVFGVPVARLADLEALRDWAAARTATIVTTAARAQHRLWDVTFDERTVILLGSEREGLDDAALAAGDVQVSIPMTGTAESLNLAQAATLLLYEVWRQR